MFFNREYIYDINDIFFLFNFFSFEINIEIKLKGVIQNIFNLKNPCT